MRGDPVSEGLQSSVGKGMHYSHAWFVAVHSYADIQAGVYFMNTSINMDLRANILTSNMRTHANTQSDLDSDRCICMFTYIPIHRHVHPLIGKFVHSVIQSFSPSVIRLLASSFMH